MAKPLAGKRLFEAWGRSASSRGLPLIHKRLERRPWPMWARSAWARGWIMQPSPRQQTERIVQSFQDEADRKGLTLRETVSAFLEAHSDA